MKTQTWSRSIIIGAMTVAPAIGAIAAEHGGKEHAGQEHGGMTPAPAPTAPTVVGAPAATEPSQQKAMPALEPSAEQIRQAIRDYIASIEQEEGAFTIEDEVTGTVRTLTLAQVHERVGKTDDAYYSCTDMKDTASGETLDLDFDVTDEDGILDVVDVRIHKVNGQPRYTYDEQDNRIPLM